MCYELNKTLLIIRYPELNDEFLMEIFLKAKNVGMDDTIALIKAHTSVIAYYLQEMERPLLKVK